MDEAKELLAEVIKKLAVSISQSIYDKAKDYFVDRELKDQVDIGLAYEEYLNKVYDTYSRSKTILYDDKPRELSSFYVPANLSQWVSWENKRKSDELYKKKIVSTKNIEALFVKDNKLIVTGIGGMGKTMLMKHFCAEAVEKGYMIPVFISLRRFNSVNINKMPLEKLIYDQLKIFGFKLDYKYFEYSLGDNRYLFLFDGYDEVSKANRSALTFAISDFAKQYSNNTFAISSRMVEEVYGFEDFTLFSICPMTREQSVQLIWKLKFDYQLKKRFIDEMTDSFYDKYKSFISVPLLLSILFLTYTSNTKLPETLNEFYEKAFETLMFKHDRLKMGFERVFQSKLQYEEFRDVFLSFCFITYFNEMYSFSYRGLASSLSLVSKSMKIFFDENAYINDLVNISCMLIHDGEEYIFIHRSFQEFFAAVLVSNKPDDEQRKLCSRYLEHKEEIREEQSYRQRAFYKISNDDGDLDFLRMLKSVEPQRFEKIVLFPITEKIVKMYQKKNNDLYLAVFSSCEFAKKALSPYIRNKHIVDKTDCISYAEFRTLINGYIQDEIAIEEIERMDNSLVQQITESAIESKLIQDGITNTTLLKGEINTILRIMTIYAIAINRYERICKQIDQNKHFSELIIDFINS